MMDDRHTDDRHTDDRPEPTDVPRRTDESRGTDGLPESPKASTPPPALRAGSLRERRRANRGRRVLPLALGLLAALALGWWISGRILPASEPDLFLEKGSRVAVLPLRNEGPRTDDWAVWGLSGAMAEGLEATSGVQVISPRQLHRTLSARNIDPAVEQDRLRARDLAVALGGELLVDVTLRRSSREGVVLDATLFDASGAELRVLEYRGGELFPLAGELVLTLADELGSGLAPVSLDRALSSDPFVDRLYAEGLARHLEDSAASARPYFEIALGNRPDFVHAKLRLIDCLRRLGELELAQELGRDVLGQAQSRGARALQARAYRELGLLLALDGDTVAADEQYRLAHRIDEQRQDPRGQAESLHEQSRLALAQGKTAEAEELLVRVLGLREQAGDRLGQIDVLVRIGSLLLSADKPADAERLFNDAATLATELRDVWNEHRIAASLGEVARRQGRLDEATEHWSRALGFYQQRGDTQRILLLSRNLAETLLQDGRYGEAEERYHDQLELAKRLENPRLEAEATVQLAWLQLRQGYPFQARELVKKALALDRHLTDRSDLQRVIAWMAYEEGDYALAVETLGSLRRQSPDDWTDGDEQFLAVYVKARVQRRRLPLPGE